MGCCMKVNTQKKLPVRKEKLLGTDDEFYDFFRHYTVMLNNILDEARQTINNQDEEIKDLKQRVKDLEEA